MGQKRIALCLYEACSLYEITELTAQLVLRYGQTIDYLATSHTPLTSEDGFVLQATKTFAQVSAKDYDCILLTGTMNPLQALYEEALIEFLGEIDTERTIVAAISSSPMFLAKAGLLRGRAYVGGIYENFLDQFEFLEKEHFTPQPVLVDGSVITAIGFAVQDFTKSVLLALGYEKEQELDSSCQWEEKDFRYRLEEADWALVLEEIRAYEKSMT